LHISCGAHNKQRFLPLNSINGLIFFVVEICRVSCELQTEFLDIISKKSSN
jgi:hypothetical protein